MNRTQLKNRAKEVFAAQRAPFILGYVIVSAVSMLAILPSYISTIQRIFSLLTTVSLASGTGSTGVLDAFNQGAAIGATAALSAGTSLVMSLFTIALMAVVFIVEVGYLAMCLRAVDGETIETTDVFRTFSEFARWVKLYFLMVVKIFLWSLLFILPGIIAALNYSQAYYIMLDDPDISAYDAIKKSVLLMQGHRWEYFVLGLSFILWNLLELVTFGLAGLYVQPYYYLTLANYYRFLVPVTAASSGENMVDIPHPPQM